MVYPDINYNLNSEKNQPDQAQYKSPVPLRILAFIIDYFIFAPVISFMVLVFFQTGIDLYKTFPKSIEAQAMFGHLVIAYLFLVTFFQALFITFVGATPGLYFLKQKIYFSNKDYPLFLQAWARQIGFTFSFLLLGLPFLKALADKKGQCFYEKMTDSMILSNWLPDQSSYFSKALDVDRKFWSSALATITSFILFLGAIVFWQNYQFTLTSPETYTKLVSKKKTCTEFSKLEIGRAHV